MVAARFNSERGVALLVVMLGVALLTLIVVDFTTAAALGYLSAANQANELRAYYLARSGINVGAALLVQDAQADASSKAAYDALTDAWAVPYPPIPVDGGTAELGIVDETSKFNINQLVDPNTGEPSEPHVEILGRLFANLGVSRDLIPAIVDWLDPDSIESPGGAEADYYMTLIPPYMPRNGPMPTIGDLRMVRGMTDAVFNHLRPYLTVMPETQVNVNTAPPQVLGALSPELQANPQLLKQIIAMRMVRPFVKASDVSHLPGVGQKGTQLTSLLTTRSQYFTITGVGSYSGARKIVRATMQRLAGGALTLAVWQED